MLLYVFFSPFSFTVRNIYISSLLAKLFFLNFYHKNLAVLCFCVCSLSPGASTVKLMKKTIFPSSPEFQILTTSSFFLSKCYDEIMNTHDVGRLECRAPYHLTAVSICLFHKGQCALEPFLQFCLLLDYMDASF